MKFAFVVPRYGADITSGPEHACRVLAQQLSERHDVDVLTTCANDPRSWKNEFSEGADRVRGVLVRRFAVSHTHDAHAFRQFSSRILASAHSRPEEIEWVKRLGPWSPGLNDHISRQQRSYDALVFFSMWHPAAVHGLQTASDRSILFPFVRMHPALRFGLWHDLIASARAIGYVSTAEKRLVRDYLRLTPRAEEVVGIGIDPPPQQTYPRHQQDPADQSVSDDEWSAGDEEPEPEQSYLGSRGVPFRRRYRLYGNYAVYAGRVDTDNGFEEMFEYFDAFAAGEQDTSLLLLGAKMMKVPDEPYVRMAGLLPDRERMIAYEAADVTLAPAAGDLLARPVLESMAVGTPVLASARNAAAVEHCRRANAGLYYANREEFAEAMRTLMGNRTLREKLGENGRQYVQQHFRWESVLGRFDRLVARVRSR